MSLIHEWTLNQATGVGAYLLDSVGTAHGTPAGTTSVLGIFDRARHFESSGLVDCGLPADLIFTTEDFSIGHWLKKITPEAWKYVYARDGVGNTSYRAAISSDGKFQFCTCVDGGVGLLYGYTSASVCDGLWHHIVTTRSGTVGKIYVDGGLDSTFTVHANIFAGTGNFIIGNNPHGYHLYNFNDPIDHVQVWNTALTAEEVHDLHYYAPLTNTLSLTNQIPLPSASGIAVDSHVQLSIADSANDIQLDTVQLHVDGNLAYDGNLIPAFQTGYDGPASAQTGNTSQYDFVIDPTTDFDWEHTVPIGVYAENDLGHILDENYDFDTALDSFPLILENQNPANGAIKQAKDVAVYGELYDDETGVNYNSIAIYVDRDEGGGSELVFDADGGGFKLGWTGSVAQLPPGNIHRYAYNLITPADFGELKTISVRVVAADNAGTPNNLDETYAFTTAEYPYFSVTNPADGAEGIPWDANIALTVDGGSGNVVKASLEVYVGAVLAYEGLTDTFKPGFQGPASSIIPNSNGYDIIMDKEVNYEPGQQIIVEVYGANDLGHEL